MARHKSWGPHGSVRRYRQGGCDDLRGGKPGAGDRCDQCKLAMSEQYLAQKNGLATARKPAQVCTNVTPIRSRQNTAPKTSREESKTDSTHEMGANERAAWAQLEPYVDSQPLRVQMALTAAKQLDDPDRGSQVSQIMRQLNETIDRLTDSGKKKKSNTGKLAIMNAMNRRSG